MVVIPGTDEGAEGESVAEISSIWLVGEWWLPLLQCPVPHTVAITTTKIAVPATAATETLDIPVVLFGSV
jgi:hypothetical protein